MTRLDRPAGAQWSTLARRPGRNPFTSFTAEPVPLPRTEWLSRSGGAKPRPNPGRSRNQHPRDTGPDATTRAAVYAREGMQCAACGVALGDGAWKSIQHRVRRQVGGNGLPNLVLLCGSATSPGCHRKAEDRIDEMHAAGFWLRADENPAEVPILLAGADGGIKVWLTADGGYSTAAPTGEL